MKAAVLHKVGSPLTIEDVSLEGPRENEVRIRVAASGLCHSDYHFMIGDLPHPLPVVLGHEAAGIVEAVGAGVTDLKRGDAVVTCISGFCGECGQCQTGHSYRCDTKPARAPTHNDARLKLDGQPLYQFGQLGGFAEEMVVHKHSVTKLPDGMPLDLACLLGCAVITGVGAALEQAQVRPGDKVVVIGCGGVGLNVIQGARIAGAAQIIAVDLNPAKLQLAKLCGATDLVLGGEGAVDSVLQCAPGGVDYAFEVIGLQSTARQAFMMLGKGGAAVLVGVFKAGAELSLPGLPFLQKEVRVIGSMMGSVSHRVAIPRYARLYQEGRLLLEPLVSKRIALAEINSGYEQLAAGETARSVITFNS